MARDVDEGQLLTGWERREGEPEVDGEAPGLLGRPTVRVRPGPGQDQGRLPVVDMPGGGDNAHLPSVPSRRSSRPACAHGAGRCPCPHSGLGASARMNAARPGMVNSRVPRSRDMTTPLAMIAARWAASALVLTREPWAEAIAAVRIGPSPSDAIVITYRRSAGVMRDQ